MKKSTALELARGFTAGLIAVVLSHIVYIIVFQHAYCGA
jgi:uncharacterized membrane protein YhhN